MGMYDEVKYKDKIYQTKSLDCKMGKYEIKNDELWCIVKDWSSKHEPYKMNNFFGEIEAYDHRQLSCWIKFQFIDGELVKKQAGHYYYEI